MNNKNWPVVKNPKPNKLKLVHDAVSYTHNLSDYDTFAKLMQDPSKRETFYNAVSRKYKLGDFDTFTEYSINAIPPKIDVLKAELNEFFGRKPKPAVPAPDVPKVTPLQGVTEIPSAGIGLEPVAPEPEPKPEQITPQKAIGAFLTGRYADSLEVEEKLRGTRKNLDKLDLSIAKTQRKLKDLSEGNLGDFKVDSRIGLEVTIANNYNAYVKSHNQLIVDYENEISIANQLMQGNLASVIKGADKPTMGTEEQWLPPVAGGEITEKLLGLSEQFVQSIKRAPAIPGAMVGLGLQFTGSLIEDFNNPESASLLIEGGEFAKIPYIDNILKPLGKEIKNLGQETREYWQRHQEQFPRSKDIQARVWDKPELMLNLKWWVANITEMTPAFGAALVVGIAGGPTLGALLGGYTGGLMEATGTYDEAIRQGDTEEEALNKAAKMTIAAGLLNAISLNRMLSPGAFNQFKNFALTGTIEMVTEYLEEPAEGFIFNESWPVFKERLKSGVDVLGPAFAMGVGGGVMVKAAQKPTIDEIPEVEKPLIPEVPTAIIPEAEIPPIITPETPRTPPATPADRVTGARAILEKAKARKVAVVTAKEAEAKPTPVTPKVEEVKPEVVEKPPKIPPQKPVTVGEKGTATTEAGTEIEFEYELYDVRDVVASLDTQFNINKEYPEELQPRDRTKMATRVQADEIIRIFNAKRLGENELVSDGAPIVTENAVVESGNLRKNVIQIIYEEGRPEADEYRNMLMENAEKFGLDPEAIKAIEMPILVRKRTSDVDVAKFVAEANLPSVAAMSAGEQAQSDAKALSASNALNLFQPGETGEINTAANRDFIRAFFSDIIGKTEVGKYITADGSISQEGINRIRNAVYASAFGDPAAIGRLAESTDDNVKNITIAMVAVAPKFSILKNQIKNGERYDLDITDDMAKAAEKLSFLREQGTTVEEYKSQTSFLDEKISPLAKDILMVLDKNKRSAKKIMEVFSTYIDMVDEFGDPKQVSMFEKGEMPTHADILQAAIHETEGKNVPDLFKAESERSEEIAGIEKTQTAGQIITPEKPAEKEVKPKEPVAPKVVPPTVPEAIEPEIKPVPVTEEKRLKFKENDVVLIPETKAKLRLKEFVGTSVKGLKSDLSGYWMVEEVGKENEGTFPVSTNELIKNNAEIITEITPEIPEPTPKAKEPEVKPVPVAEEAIKPVSITEEPYSAKVETQQQFVSELEEKTDLLKDKDVPGTLSDTGGYAETPNIHELSMGLPEIVELAKNLLGGKYPKIKKKLSGTAIGKFRPIGEGKIEIQADIFADLNEATNTLAHEIGHLVDWLPEHDLKRGNILGHVASLKNYLKHYIAGRPGGDPPLTQKDKDRLRREAIKLVGEKAEIWVDEEIKREIPLTPDDVLNIWRSTAAQVTDKKLYDYIAKLNRAEKKSIVKEALKGILREDLKRFNTIIIEKTGRKIKKKIEVNEQKVLDKYHKLIEDEIKKRELLSRDVIMNELKSFTMIWKPFNPNTNFKYTEYRYKLEELYADALSALITNPQFLKDKAPQFYEGFFNYLDNNPPVRDMYNKIQNDLKSGTTQENLVKRTREGFEQKEKEYQEELKRNSTSIYSKDAWGTAFIDQYYSLYRYLRKIGESNIPAELNPRYKIENMVYSGSEAEGYLADLEKNVLKPIKDASITTIDLGEYLFHWRVNTERAKLANPLGWTPERSAKRLAEMEKDLGSTLKEAKDAYRKIREEWYISRVRDARMYTEELVKTIEETENYAAFDIVGHLEEKYGGLAASLIYRQIGTFTPTGNPFTATVLKDLALMKSINKNIAAKSTVEFFNEYFPDDISDADTKWNGKFHAVVESGDPNKKLIVYLQDGKAVGKYLPKYVAESFRRNPVETILISQILRVMASPQKAIFTGKNPGFWPFNMIRDYLGTVKQIKGLTLSKFAPYYIKSIAPGFKSSFGVDIPLVKDMLKNNELISIADYRGDNPEGDLEIEKLLKRHHIYDRSMKVKDTATAKEKIYSRFDKTIVQPFRSIWYWMESVGTATERITKIAGRKYLDENFPDMPKEYRSHLIRTRVGSPDFLRRGTLSPIFNNFLLYSNAAKEGYRSAYESGRENPIEYLWKTIKYNVIPKIAMKAAAVGLLGLTIKSIMDRVSEYDESNYAIIPLGMTPNGKAVYFRVPQDELGRLVGGLTWKIFEKDKEAHWTNLFDYMSGQAPTLAPIFKVMWGVVTYMGGRNPYDHFRGRHAIDERVFSVGGERAHKQLAKWISNQLGGGIIHRFKSDEREKVETEIEKIIGFPVINNILGRFIKVSDYGLREKIGLEFKKLRALANETNLLAHEGIEKLFNDEELNEEEVLAIAAKINTIESYLIKSMAYKYGNVYMEKLLSATNEKEKIVVLKIMLEDEFIKKKLKIEEDEK